MDQLSEDAKKLIEEQCATVLERYKDALREVEIYKWAARVFFTLVLGGSIVGFFQLQNYLDDRIAKGTSNLDALFLSRQLADRGQPRDALPGLLEFAHSVSSTSPPENVRTRGERNLFGDFAKAGPSIRTYFFLTLLDVLSAIPSTDPDDAKFGQTEWDELLRNRKFQAEFVQNPRWMNDAVVANRFGIATVKFASNHDEAFRAGHYFERELQFAYKNDDRAACVYRELHPH